MKKLITGAVASLALLFGFASCSGDLHDNDVQPLTITGLCGTAVVPMELVNADGSLQKLTFKVSEDTKIKSLDSKNPEYALKDGWGGISNINFKLIPSDAVGANYEPTWSMDFGGPKDNDLYLSATKSESYTQLKSRAEFSSGFPSNIHISGTIVNEEYTIWAKYNAASQSCSVWISGAASDPAEIRLTAGDNSKNFPAKDKDGKDVTYKMEKAGSAYTYTFIAKADEALNLSFENDLAGTLSKDLPLTTVKNVEYKITVDVSKGISNPTVKSEVVDMLKDATVNANWKYADAASAYAEKITSDSYQFFAEREEIDFTVLRHDGGVWGKHNVGTFNIDSDAVELAYSTAKDAAKATTVKVKGLNVGTCYKVVLEKNNDDFTLKAKVVTVPLADLTGKKFKGAFDGWDKANGWKGFDLTKQSDGTWTVDFTVSEAQADSYEFGIYGNGDDKWATGEVKADGEYHEIGYAGPNAKMSGVTSGKTYTFIVKPGYGKIEAKIVEKQ